MTKYTLDKRKEPIKEDMQWDTKLEMNSHVHTTSPTIPNTHMTNHVDLQENPPFHLKHEGAFHQKINMKETKNKRKAKKSQKPWESM